MRSYGLLAMMFGALALSLLFLCGLLDTTRMFHDDGDGLISIDHEHQGSHHAHHVRSTRQLTTKTPKIGTVPLDLYRTYREKTFLFIIPYREYSISNWRLYLQVFLLNRWYDNHLYFTIANIYSIEKYHVVTDESTALDEFARSSSSSDVRNPRHLSVLYSKQLQNLYGRASGINVPLGGDTTTGMAPAVIVGMSQSSDGGSWLLRPFANYRLGLGTIAGGTLAHEIGHIVGLYHTAWSSEGVYEIPLSDCGADSTNSTSIVRYPYFNRDDLDDNTVISGGVTYRHEDWLGRSNVMAPFRFDTHIPNLFSIGIFREKYDPLFQQIIACWWRRSTTS